MWLFEARPQYARKAATDMQEKNNGLGCLRVCLALVLIHAYFLLGAGGAQTPYYEGKTVTILRGGSPGGYGTLQAQALMPYLKKYIPGNPFIFIDHMPGAAGRTAANHIYSSAKPDGLTIGAVGNVLVSGPILGLPGSKYDLDRLIYLGSTESGRPTALGTRKEAGLDNLEKLRAATGVRIGAHSVGHITYVTGRIFAYLLGVKEPRFVVGYSAPERDAALMAGEVDAGTMSPSTIQQNPALLEKVHLHALVNLPRGKYHPVYPPGVPEIDVFAGAKKEQELLKLYRAFLYPRWPYFLPPDTPKELVAVLSQAMAKAFKDPGFEKDFKKLTGSDPSPLTAGEVEEAIRDMPRNPEIIAFYKTFAGPGPLPAR
jgi:tripartite-type tricarboxylate transporter receptor subunit TctC